MSGDLLNHHEAAFFCFMVVAVGFIFFSILISCIPREMNDLIFTKLDSSANDADIIQKKKKKDETKQKQNKEDYKDLHLCIGFLICPW